MDTTYPFNIQPKASSSCTLCWVPLWGIMYSNKKTFLFHIRILEVLTHALFNWILETNQCRTWSGNWGSEREGGRAQAKGHFFMHAFIHPFIYSFREWLEFFRIDFGIDLSSHRKYWLLSPEDPGACERKEHLFHWCGLPRRAAALLDTEGGTECRKVAFFKLCFSLLCSSQCFRDWSYWQNRGSQKPLVNLEVSYHITLSFQLHNISAIMF